MIISASRRTDLPAFYARWFIQRLRAGCCTVPNPFNPQQVDRVSLLPEDVDVVVFWTRNPRPLFPYLDELDERGFRYYFQFTLLDNPRLIDPHVPRLPAALATFQKLAERIGSQRVIWRYDPIVLSEITPPAFHLEAYAHIAEALRGCAFRSVISLMDAYPKIGKRLKTLAEQGVRLLPCDPSQEWFGEWMRSLVAIGTANGMEVMSCAEPYDLRPYGVCPGKCVDDEYIARVFGLEVSHVKHTAQRKACGCVVSKDIGMYDSCLFGCCYCYATGSFARAQANYRQHNPDTPSLLGWYE
jgi:Domain of unknown function (DUF1848)